MLEQSTIYNFILRFYGVLSLYFKHSIFGRCLLNISCFTSNIWHKSLFYSILFKKGNSENKFKSSLCGKFLSNISKLLVGINGFFAPHTSKSLIFTKTQQLYGNILYFNLRIYGMFFVFISAIPISYSFITSNITTMTYVHAALFILGLFFMILNLSFAQIYNGSWFMQKLIGFFYLGFITNKVINYNRKYNIIIIALSIVIIGLSVASIFISSLILGMAIVAIVGTTLTFCRIEIGIFAAAFLIPILPTMPVLALLFLIVFTYFSKLILGKASLKFSTIDLFILIFAAIAAFSLFISYNIQNSIPTTLVYLLFVLFYFAVKNTINTKQKLYAIMSILVFSGLVVASYGVYQRITGNFVMTAGWVDADYFDETLVRIYSTLENPNVLGEYLIFISIFSFGMLYYMKGFWHKLAAFSIFSISAVCMVFTQSRGAWLGLAAAAAIFILSRDKKLLILGIFGLLAAPFIIPPDVILRFISIGDLTDSSTAFRVSIWLASIDMIRAFWPIGIGLGTQNFVFIYNIYGHSAAYALHSHNLYLQIIINLGIAGFIAFVIYMSLFFKQTLLTLKQSDRFIKTIAASLCAAMVGFLIQGLTDNVWFNYRILSFFWLILAIGAGLTSITIKEDKNAKNQI